jgi:putative ABC transport system permease protein
MRFADLVRLSLFALSRHKVRTLLTILGVLFGTLVLAISLSVRQGVQETIVRQVGKYVELRRVEVTTLPGKPKPLPPPSGKMSAARSDRLRQEMERRQGRRDTPPENRLTIQHVGKLAELDHVTRVYPTLMQYGRARLGEQRRYASFVGITPDMRETLAKRIEAGAVPDEEDDSGVLVSEYLLYDLGVVDEAAARKVVGQTLEFEVRTGNRPQSGLLLTLLGGGGGNVSVSQENVLGKVLRRLPDALDRLGLDSKEQDAMRQMLRAVNRPATKEQGVRGYYVIRGVVRATAADQPRRHGDWMLWQADLFLAPRPAQAFTLQVPAVKEHGLGQLIVEVDDMENVKAVQEEINALGFQTRSAVDYIEREQLTYLIVFTSMSVVALIALLVAAIGITNTMLMSVLERTREIGVMKAVGAGNRHVLLLFLMEGALIGVVGGLLGLLSAWGVSFPADAWSRSMVSSRLNIKLDGSLFAFPWWLIAGAPAFAVGVTVLAAWYPAHRALRIDPVEALRHE